MRPGTSAADRLERRRGGVSGPGPDPTPPPPVPGGEGRWGRVPWGAVIRPVGGVLRVPGAHEVIHVTCITLTVDLSPDRHPGRQHGPNGPVAPPRPAVIHSGKGAAPVRTGES
ncbi:hypothetical protein GCM10010504_46510 [Streptomyces griseus]|nr:hypothetical protein GCM10010504_46510 [Streptomyces griseus]